MQFDCECGLATAYEDPPECPECGRRMKHLRLEVLEREHAEFFERWHEHRRAIEAMVRVLGPSAPTCDGCAVEIEEALKIARKLGYGETAPEGHNAEVTGRPLADGPVDRRVGGQR